VFFLFVFMIIEFGHAQLVHNLMNSACRNAARLGAVEGTTSDEVVDRVNQTMASAVPTAVIDVFVKDASVYDDGTPPTDGEGIEALADVEVADAESRDMFVVRATVPYNEIALVPVPFMSDVVLESQAFMRHE
jgi:hypothetical protein